MNTGLSMMLDDQFFRGVLEGSITATIRIGDRPAELGRLTFMAARGGYLPLLVNINQIIPVTYAGINDVDARLSGFTDAEDARRALLEFYPLIRPSTPMTVLRFERV